MIYTTQSNIQISERRISLGDETKKVELVSYMYGDAHELIDGLPGIVLSRAILRMIVWSPIK